MPPNLLKPTFERGELDNFEKNDCFEKDRVRTDFILQNIYSYLLGKRCNFKPVLPMNKDEEFVMRELEGTVSAFHTNYGNNVKSLCAELEITEDTIGTVLHGVSNELFSDGITWSRIIALFVFVSELALLCLSKKYPESIVNDIYECFSKLVKEKLKSWVDDHGGWEGLTTLSFAKPGNTSMLEPSKMSNSGWAKSLLYSTVRMVGTLAHIANTSSHMLP